MVPAPPAQPPPPPPNIPPFLLEPPDIAPVKQGTLKTVSAAPLDNSALLNSIASFSKNGLKSIDHSEKMFVFLF